MIGFTAGEPLFDRVVHDVAMGVGVIIPPWKGSLAAARACSFHGSISSCDVGVDVILHSDADSIIHISTTR